MKMYCTSSARLQDQPFSKRSLEVDTNPTLVTDLQQMWALLQEKMKVQFQAQDLRHVKIH